MKMCEAEDVMGALNLPATDQKDRSTTRLDESNTNIIGTEIEFK